MPHRRSYKGRKNQWQRRYNFLEYLQIQDAILAEIKDQNPKDTLSGEKAFNLENREQISKLFQTECLSIITTFFFCVWCLRKIF